MTTRHTYECNLCGTRLRDQDSDAHGKPGVGILWAANGKDFNIKRLRDAENHMCAGCIELLVRKWPNPQQELHRHE